MSSDDNEEIAELPEDAIEAVVESEPSLVESAVEVARSQDHTSVIGLYQRELEGEAEKEHQALLLHEIGEIQEHRLRDEGDALKTYAKALQIDPTLQPNVWAIRRIFWRRSLWPNLLKLLDVEIRFAASEAERAELLLEKGQLLEDKLEDHEQALECYRKALEHAPDHLGTLMALERLSVGRGDVETLAREVYPPLARVTPDPARRVAILLDLARLLEKQVDAQGEETPPSPPAGADAAPGREPVAEGVAGAGEAAVEAAAEAAAEADTEGSADTDEAVAEATAAKAGAEGLADDGEAAAEATAEAGAEGLADDGEATAEATAEAGAEGLADDGEAAAEATAEAGAEGLTGAGEAAAEAESSGLAGPAARQPEARIVRGVDGVLAVLEDAYAVGVERDRVLREIERVATAAGRRRELLDVWERRLDLLGGTSPDGENSVPPPPAEVAAIRRRQAQIAREGGDLESAWAYLSRALAALPEEPLLLHEAVDLAASLGRHGDVAELLARQLVGMAEDDPRRFGTMLHRAVALATFGQHEEAAQLTSALVASNPTHLLLLDQQLHHAVVTGDADRLCRVLGDKAQAVVDGASGLPPLPPGGEAEWAAALMVVRGEILEHQLGRDDEAAQAYREALDLVPRYRPAVDALETLLTRRGQPQELAELLAAELEGADGERLDILLETLVRLYADKLIQPSRALDCLRRLVEIHPGDYRIRRRLQEGLVACGEWAEVVELNEALASEVPSGTQAAALRLDSASICDRELADPGRAVEHLERVLSDVPAHPVAAAMLEGILRREGRHEDLVRALTREVEGTLNQERATTLLLKVGLLQERESPGEAARIYQEILDRSPGYAPALHALAQAHRRAGDYEQLAHTLEAECELLEAPETRATVLERLGVLQEDRLGNADAADEAYSRALELKPDSVSAAVGSLRVAAQRHDLGRSAEVSEQLAGVLQDESARAALLEEAAVMASRPEGDPEVAARLWAEVRSVAPDRLGPIVAQGRAAAHSGAMTELGQAHADVAGALDGGDVGAMLAARAGALAEASGDLEAATSRYLEASAWSRDLPDALVPLCDVANQQAIDAPAVLMRRVALAEGDQRVQLLLERAEALEDRGRLREAAVELSGVLAAAPDHVAAIEMVRRLAKRGGDRQAVAHASTRLGVLLHDPERRAAMYREAARIVDGELGNSSEAAPMWRQVLEHAPNDEEAYDRLRQILAEAGDHVGLHEVLSFRIRQVLDGDARIPYLRERASIRLEHLADRDGAIRDLRQILDIDPDHLEGQRELGYLLAEAGEHAQALEMLERAAEGTDDREQTVQVLLRMAEIQDVSLGEPETAIRTLRRAVEVAPREPFAYERLATIYGKMREHQRAVEVLGELGKTRSDPTFKARVEIRAAGVCRDGLRDLDAAARALERARQLDPFSLDALTELLAVLELQRNVSARNLLMSQAIDEARDALAQNPRRVALFNNLARLFEWSDDADGHVQAAQCLAFYNMASAADAEVLSRRGTPGFAPQREVSQESWRNRLTHPLARRRPAEVWTIIANAVRQIHPHDLSAYRVGKGERVNLKSKAAEWPTLERLARVLGVTGFEVYRSPDQPELAVALATNPPALVVGSAMAGTPAPHLRYRLGHALAVLRERAVPVLSVDADELAVLFAAAARVGGERVAFSVPEEPVANRTRLLTKAMSRSERKALTVLAGAIAREIVEPRDFRFGISMTAARAGLLAAGDLGTALGEMAPEIASPTARKGLSAEEILARMGEARECLEMLGFAVSADFLALRGELGLKVGQSG